MSHRRNSAPADFGGVLVVYLRLSRLDKIHAAGKKTGIFWGDHWIGAEFYHPLKRWFQMTCPN